MAGSFPLVRRLAADPIWHVVLPIIVLIGVGIVMLAIYLPDAMQSAAIDAAYRGNLEVVDQIKITRGYYTQYVVSKAREPAGLRPSFRHKDDPGAIPLPATFVMDVSDLLQAKDMTLSLTSPYPWPHRADRTMDDFQMTAWEAFREDPTMVFSRQEIRGGRRVLRVAVADRLTSEMCVSCHNSDPQSAKRDWKLGDVRGVMEVTKVIEPSLADAERRSRKIILIVGGAAVALASVLVIFAGLVVRRTREKHERDQEVRFLADHDPMTHMLNRASFIKLLTESLELPSASRERIAVHYVDLDRFKEINDKFGHSTGDELIRAVADRLRGVVGRNDLLARLGGDDFGVAQRKVASRSEATKLAAAIVEALSRPFKLQRHQVTVSASVGVRLSAHRNESADDLLKAADIALSEAKTAGRDRFVLFASSMLDELNVRRSLQQTIRQAVKTDGFHVHFQPICNAKTGRIEGFETVLRLQDAAGKFISPARFLPVAEEIGLIAKIGTLVIRRACAVAATWPADLSVAVSLSPGQFTSAHEDTGRISEIVGAALAEAGLAPHRLELAITEGLLLEASEGVIDELHKLKKLGASLVMDDFGAGYSSLSYLWKLPIDKIKINRSFTAASAGAGSTMGPILKAITALGHSLDMRVRVVGVETSEQAAFIAGLRCDQLQGLFFGGPMPVTEVAVAIFRNGRNETGSANRPAGTALPPSAIANANSA